MATDLTMKSIHRLWVVFLCVFRLFASPFSDEVPSARLVVYLVVDQMRDDYLDRFGDLFDGGYKYLLDNGVRFTHTHHAHAYASTAPGHLVLGSGVFPGSAGIIANQWYDRKLKTDVYCVADRDNVERALQGKWGEGNYIEATSGAQVYYKSGEVIPGELVDRMLAAKNLNSGTKARIESKPGGSGVLQR